MEGLSQLPAISEVNGLSDAEAMRVVRVLFEPAPVLEAHLLKRRPWQSYGAVVEAAEELVEQLQREGRREELLSVMSAHPKIGEAKDKLSADSRAEQGADADQHTLRELARLNDEYEKKHGFR